MKGRAFYEVGAMHPLHERKPRAISMEHTVEMGLAGDLRASTAIAACRTEGGELPEQRSGKVDFHDD